MSMRQAHIGHTGLDMWARPDIFHSHHPMQHPQHAHQVTAPKLPSGNSGAVARVFVALCLICLLCTGAVAIGVVVATHAPTELANSLTSVRTRIQAEDVVIAGAVAGAHAGAAAGGRVGSERRKRTSQLLEQLRALGRGDGDVTSHFPELLEQNGSLRVDTTLRVLARALAELAAEVSVIEAQNQNS